MAFRRFYVFRPLNFLLSGLLWKERYCRAFSWTVQLAFAIQDLNSNKRVQVDKSLVTLSHMYTKEF